ncbi:MULTISPECIES: Bug family tripartite tricarboxylate transporter substrate binding protein [Cupriavidus]
MRSAVFNKLSILFMRLAMLTMGLLSQAHAAGGMPVRLIVPYPAGGPTDIVARTIAPALGAELNQTIVIDNRAGASGSIGAGVVARAAPDGNTLMLNTSIHTILPHLMKLPNDAIKDFTALAQVNSIPFVLVANKDLPYKTVPELIAYAKAHPGEINYATNSAGSASHMAAELFRRAAGIDIRHVPYKGSAPALTDLVGGQVQIMFEQGPSVAPFLKSGQLQALGVTSPARTLNNPELPTLAESGLKDFSYSNWQGIWAPAGLPPAVAKRLVEALQRALEHPEVQQKLRALGTEPASRYGADFQAFVKQQFDQQGALIKSAGIKLD